MVRDYVIEGEVLVKVKGGAQWSGIGLGSPTELGLSSDQITIRPNFKHKDINITDFGPEIPVEVLWNLADVTITMNLVHYDRAILERCMIESMGGGRFVIPTLPIGALAYFAGTMAPAGTALGNGKELFASGCHFISLNLLCAQSQFNWRFPSSYMCKTPVEIPLGTQASVVKVEWRAIPYSPLRYQSGILINGVLTTQPFAVPASEVIFRVPTEQRSSGIILFDHFTDT